MGRIINSTYISLDGVVEQPHEWPTIERPPDERGGQIQTDLLLACDAVLMGRRTYEGFAPVWQTRSGDLASDRKMPVSYTSDRAGHPILPGRGAAADQKE